jgi:hypothetical protein
VRGGTLPLALLYTALGLALAFAPRRAWGPSMVALTTTAATLSFARIPCNWLEFVFLGCWMSVAASAGTVHLPAGLGSRAAVALSVNAGFWSGAVVTLAGSRLNLVKALPCALVLLPAAWIVRWRVPIVVKVISSWLIAVAMLAAMLPFLRVSPGYVPDHME